MNATRPLFLFTQIAQLSRCESSFPLQLAQFMQDEGTMPNFVFDDVEV
jgi:hypothetical protein